MTYTRNKLQQKESYIGSVHETQKEHWFEFYVYLQQNKMPSFWNEAGIRANADLSSTSSVSTAAGFCLLRRAASQETVRQALRQQITVGKSSRNVLLQIYTLLPPSLLPAQVLFRIAYLLLPFSPFQQHILRGRQSQNNSHFSFSKLLAQQINDCAQLQFQGGIIVPPTRKYSQN